MMLYIVGNPKITGKEKLMTRGLISVKRSGKVLMKIIAFTDGSWEAAKRLAGIIELLWPLKKIRDVYKEALNQGFGTIDSLIVITGNEVYEMFEEGDRLTEKEIDKLKKTFDDPDVDPLGHDLDTLIIINMEKKYGERITVIDQGGNHGYLSKDS